MSELRNPFYDPLLQEKQTEYPRGRYNSSPAFELEHGEINQGYSILAEQIKQKIPDGLRVLVMDGFLGVNWQSFKNKLSQALNKKSLEVAWLDVNSCLAESSEIRNKVEPFMGGNDRIFGTHYPFGPEVFFDAKKIADYRIQASIARGDKAGHLTIFYGCGAFGIWISPRTWHRNMPGGAR
jgi:hypothetical protein